MGLNVGNVNTIQNFTFGTDKTWSSVTDDTAVAQTVTVAGLKIGDRVIVDKPTAQAGLGVVGSRVSAADTLSITFIANGGAVTPTAGESWLGTVFKSALPTPTNASI